MQTDGDRGQPPSPSGVARWKRGQRSDVGKVPRSSLGGWARMEHVGWGGGHRGLRHREHKPGEQERQMKGVTVEHVAGR